MCRIPTWIIVLIATSGLFFNLIQGRPSDNNDALQGIDVSSDDVSHEIIGISLYLSYISYLYEIV